LAIGLGVESSGFCELGVQQRPETWPKGVEELVVLVRDDGLWYPKVDLHSFKEEIMAISATVKLFLKSLRMAIFEN
jgi:hypothetical protein